MRRLAAFVGAAALIAGSASSARASSIIYDGGSPDQQNFYFATTTGLTPDDVAESFVLQAGATTVTDAHWWGSCFFLDTFGVCPAADLTIAFYEDENGLPGTLIQSHDVGGASQTATGDLIADFWIEYAYSATFAPLALTAGTTYWFAIHSDVTDLFWGWETTSGDGSHARHSGGAWSLEDDNLAFYLTGETAAVPEPTSLILFGSGALGLLARMRRRKQQ